jgi:hypothetical protein
MENISIINKKAYNSTTLILTYKNRDPLKYKVNWKNSVQKTAGFNHNP